MMKNNPPLRGTCSSCENPSIRLLNPPVIQIQVTDAKDYRAGMLIRHKIDHPFSELYEVIEVEQESIVCLVPESDKDASYCYKCFDGHIWPALRPHVINMPPEFVFSTTHPWAAAKWKSAGRECA